MTATQARSFATAEMIRVINAGNNSYVVRSEHHNGDPDTGLAPYSTIAFRSSDFGRGPIRLAASDIGCRTRCAVHVDVVGDTVTIREVRS